MLKLNGAVIAAALAVAFLTASPAKADKIESMAYGIAAVAAYQEACGPAKPVLLVATDTYLPRIPREVMLEAIIKVTIDFKKVGGKETWCPLVKPIYGN